MTLEGVLTVLGAGILSLSFYYFLWINLTRMSKNTPEVKRRNRILVVLSILGGLMAIVGVTIEVVTIINRWPQN